MAQLSGGRQALAGMRRTPCPLWVQQLIPEFCHLRLCLQLAYDLIRSQCFDKSSPRPQCNIQTG